MGSILDFIKPICLFANRNKNNRHKKRQQHCQKDEKNEQLLKNNRLTLQECILSSPSFNMKSSPLPSAASSSKRVHPNPQFVNENVSMETLLLGDSWNPLFENDDMGMKRIKKRVSFRKPEVADIFILAAESPDIQQDFEQL